MEKENKPKNIYQMIAEITAMMAKEGIAKDNENEQQRFMYRGIDDVYNALGKMLGEVGMVIIPRVLNREVTERATKSGGALFYVNVDVEYDLISSQDGSKHVSKVMGEAMDSADKATNKAMSAAYKYLCFQVFCIPTEGDNDADEKTHGTKKGALKNDPDIQADMANMGYDPEKVSDEMISKIQMANDLAELKKIKSDNVRHINTLPAKYKEMVIGEYNGQFEVFKQLETTGMTK